MAPRQSRSDESRRESRRIAAPSRSAPPRNARRARSAWRASLRRLTRPVARPVPAAKTEHHLCDAPHLYLLRAFGNSIAPMMPVDVLERLVAGIAKATVNLHRAIGGLAYQPVRAIVAHRNFIR